MTSEDLEVFIEVKTGENTVSSKFSGEASEVVKAVQKFLSDSVPAFSVGSKIFLRIPSASELADMIGPDVKISGADIIFIKKPADAMEGIRKALVAARVANELSARTTPTLSVKEIAVATGIAEKTINNNLTKLTKQGEVERAAKGVYKITDRGILETSPMISPPGDVQ